MSVPYQVNGTGGIPPVGTHLAVFHNHHHPQQGIVNGNEFSQPYGSYVTPMKYTELQPMQPVYPSQVNYLPSLPKHRGPMTEYFQEGPYFHGPVQKVGIQRENSVQKQYKCKGKKADLCSSKTDGDEKPYEYGGFMMDQYNEILNFLERGVFPDRFSKKSEFDNFKRRAKQFVSRDGVLYYQAKGEQSQRRVIKKGEAEMICQEIHDVHHKGENNTRQLVTKNYYWKSLTADVAQFVKTCQKCQRQQFLPKSGPKLKTITPSRRFGQRWGIDLVTIKASNEGYRYMFTAVCYLSKYVWLTALKSKNSGETTKAVKQLFANFGYPNIITTDQGGEFRGQFQEYMDEISVRHIRTSAYHPQANGLCERANQTAKRTLTKLADGKTDEWEKYLPEVMMGNNSNKHRSTKMSGYFVAFGFHPRVEKKNENPIDDSDEDKKYMFDDDGLEAIEETDEDYEEKYNSMFATASDDEDERLMNVELKPPAKRAKPTDVPPENVVRSQSPELFSQRMEDLHDAAFQNIAVEQKKQRIDHDKKYGDRLNFVVGNLVMIHDSKNAQREATELGYNFSKPYEIVRLTKGKTAQLKNVDTGKLLKKSVALDRLLVYHARDDKDGVDHENDGSHLSSVNENSHGASPLVGEHQAQLLETEPDDSLLDRMRKYSVNSPSLMQSVNAIALRKQKSNEKKDHHKKVHKSKHRMVKKKLALPKRVKKSKISSVKEKELPCVLWGGKEFTNTCQSDCWMTAVLIHAWCYPKQYNQFAKDSPEYKCFHQCAADDFKEMEVAINQLRRTLCEAKGIEMQSGKFDMHQAEAYFYEMFKQRWTIKLHLECSVCGLQAAFERSEYPYMVESPQECLNAYMMQLKVGEKRKSKINCEACGEYCYVREMEFPDPLPFMIPVLLPLNYEKDYMDPLDLLDVIPRKIVMKHQEYSLSCVSLFQRLSDTAAHFTAVLFVDGKKKSYDGMAKPCIKTYSPKFLTDKSTGTAYYLPDCSKKFRDDVMREY